MPTFRIQLAAILAWRTNQQIRQPSLSALVLGGRHYLKPARLGDL
jgi:hypothetical protein